MHKLVNMTNGYFTEGDLEYAKQETRETVRGLRRHGPMTRTEALRANQAIWRDIVEMPLTVLSAETERRIGRRMVAAYACLARGHEADRRRIVEDHSDSILARP